MWWLTTNTCTHSMHIEYLLRFQPLLWRRQLQAVRPGCSRDHIQSTLIELEKHGHKYHPVLMIFSCWADVDTKISFDRLEGYVLVVQVWVPAIHLHHMKKEQDRWGFSRHTYLFATWCLEASYTTRPCWTSPRTRRASSWTCGSFQRCPNSPMLTMLTAAQHPTANGDVQHELHIVPLWRPILPTWATGLRCQKSPKSSLTATLKPQASQSRDRVVLTTEAGLRISDMEPHFQNPHLDYQISVFPLPPEVTFLYYMQAKVLAVPMV